MATLTVISPSIAGTTFAAASAAEAGDVFANNGKTFLYIKNGDAGSHTVTITPQNTVGAGYTISPIAVAVGAGVEKIIGPFDPQYFNNSSGQAVVTYDAVTSVTVKPVSS